MPLTPPKKRLLGHRLFSHLKRQILEGELKVREQLPSERILSEQYGVHRGVVREAIKRLEAQQLVETRHGGGTRVLNFRETGGLELLNTMVTNSDGTPNISVIKDIIEWREDLGSTMARRAAMRGSETLATTLDDIVNSMEDNLEDLSKLQDLALEYWEEIALASGNLAYRLALNSLKYIYVPFRESLQPLLKTELQNIQGHRELTDAIRNGSGDEAARLTRSLESIKSNKIIKAFNLIIEMQSKDQENNKDNVKQRKQSDAI
ncbi:MAG: FadR family transcriptional regulator [Pseudomonadales bacterium]|nr:FadR family transcriptional regulator [Pseudomonadales bacterium]